MNPAALKANLRDMTPGSTLLINVDAFDTRNLDKAGYDSRTRCSTTRWRAFTGLRSPDDLDHRRGNQAARREAPRRRALQELLRTRPDLVDVRPAHRAAARVDQDPLRQSGRWCSEAQHSRRSTPATTSARPPSCSTTPTRSSPPHARAGHLSPQHHRERRVVVRARRGRAAGQAADLLRVVPDHAGVRHPPRAVEAEELRREDAPVRRRDRRRRRGGGRRVRPAALGDPARPAVPVST